ncbi:MAG: histidinol-phosphate transaminase [Candidatus Micrarchaeaceae archaeon]
MSKHRIIHADYSGSSFMPPHEVMDAIRRSVSKVNFYPYEGYSDIRRAIASYCGVKEENILVTNGGDEAITLITNKFGQRVLIPAPTYGEYERIAKSRGYSMRIKNCMDESNSYKLNYTKGDLSWATLAWICNPNNPTGTLIPKEDIMRVVKSTKAIVVSDEAHYEYARKTVAKEVSRHKNLIVIRTFSKGFGISGLRLGYMIADPKIVNMFSMYNQEYNVNRVARAAGISALRNKEHYMHKIAEAKKIRDRFQRFARRIGLYASDSKAGFVFLKFRDAKEAEYVHRKFLDDGIITFTASSSEFTGLNGPYMRIALCDQKGMEVIQDSLGNAIKEYRASHK